MSGIWPGSPALATHSAYGHLKPPAGISRIHVCFGYRRSVTVENFSGSHGGFEVAFKGQCSACSKFLPIGYCTVLTFFFFFFLMYVSQAPVRKGTLD